MNNLITQYEQEGRSPKAAIAGLTSEQLNWAPPASANAGAWSIQQVILHIMDSELIGADRMKRIIAEDNPLITWWDENRFAQHLGYEQQSVEDAVTLIEINRRQFARILRTLKPQAMARTGIHTQTGKITLESELNKYIWHLNHHLSFVHKKRELLPKKKP
ncbi:MAG TPA: DinB family protein [Tepidisphaeraceae bacterium]|nr:DinB family protein [Tepidisphaeraceae bacterium]